VPAEIYLNVAIGGLLTGLVYGLMALGLSVIFGVVRVVNFAHGEMMTIAMYLAVVLFASLGLDPLVMMLPIAAILFVVGYLMQWAMINPFISRPEHSQFLLMLAVAIIIVNSLLLLFGPDAKGVQTSYEFDSFAIGSLIVDATKLYAGIAAILVAAALFAFFQFATLGKKYPGVNLNTNHIYTFEALLVAADAYKRAKSADPKALADAIRSTDIKDNVSTGPGISFNAKGQNDKLKNAAIQNRGGKLVTVAPKGSTNAKVQWPMLAYDKRR
jgi:hypothetical protein